MNSNQAEFKIALGRPVKRNFTRVSLLMFSVLLTLDSMAFPSAKVDFGGLGKNRIAEAIIGSWMVAPERFLKPRLEAALQKQTGELPITQEIAKEAGFTCNQGVLSCIYKGSLAYQLMGLPQEKKQTQEQKMDFEIKIITVQPVGVSVQITRFSD